MKATAADGILIESILEGSVGGPVEPMVQVSFGENVGSLTPNEARTLALTIAQAATVAEDDSIFAEWLMQKMKVDEPTMQAVLDDLRKTRNNRDRERGDYHVVQKGSGN